MSQTIVYFRSFQKPCCRKTAEQHSGVQNQIIGVKGERDQMAEFLSNFSHL